jgi:hypothetical protein
MKKIIAIVFAVSSLFFLTASKVLAEWSAGVSVSHGAYSADGQEIEDGETNKTASAEEGRFTFPSLFVEYNLGLLSVGFDVIPGSVTTEENSRTDLNLGISNGTGNDGTTTGVTNKASVEISRHVSLYAVVPITDIGAFARVSIMRADVETKETLGTGSVYPDTNMEGASISLGYQHDTDGGFLRVELGYSDYETVKVTSSNSHRVEADVSGDWARISIGRTF